MLVSNSKQTKPDRIKTSVKAGNSFLFFCHGEASTEFYSLTYRDNGVSQQFCSVQTEF